MARGQVGHVVKISLDTESLCGVITNNRRMRGSFVIQMSGVEYKETMLPYKEIYKRKLEYHK
jgi:hypothetical protein